MQIIYQNDCKFHVNHEAISTDSLEAISTESAWKQQLLIVSLEATVTDTAVIVLKLWILRFSLETIFRLCLTLRQRKLHSCLLLY